MLRVQPAVLRPPACLEARDPHRARSTTPSGAIVTAEHGGAVRPGTIAITVEPAAPWQRHYTDEIEIDAGPADAARLGIRAALLPLPPAAMAAPGGRCPAQPALQHVERDRHVLQRGRRDHERVEDLVVAEHRRGRGRAGAARRRPRRACRACRRRDQRASRSRRARRAAAGRRPPRPSRAPRTRPPSATSGRRSRRRFSTIPPSGAGPDRRSGSPSRARRASASSANGV